ncbi:MAG: arginine--tRNA ligase, partial [Chloroflexi bacterium]|nr:arginine--tRNA ligase [Chloroflexota bacterium]
MDDTSTLRSLVRDRLSDAWRHAVAEGTLPALPVDSEPVDVELSRPAKAEHGDLASNLALKLARPLRRPPMAISAALVEALVATGAVGEDGPIIAADVAPPGFLNLRIAPHQLERSLDAARDAGEGFGHLAAEPTKRINVEFVSANPTGPLTVGNARGAFVGDLLSRVLEAAGHSVTREYYFNDANDRVDVLGASVAARRTGQPLPEDAYRGEYVATLASELPDEVWSRAIEPGAARDAILGAWAGERIRAGIEQSLEHLGVRFDIWKTETSLHREGWVERAVERLRAGGHIFEQDGATWFRSTAFGDDKDRVVYRSNGTPTYFAADIGYVTEKFSRGFDK